MFDTMPRGVSITVLLMLAGLLLCGCRSVKYVPVETVRTDTTYISQIRVDSVFHRDSVFIEHKGDTVWLEKYRYVYKYVQAADTVWHERVDTVQVAYPVEKELTRWQNLKMEAGGYGIIASLVLAAACMGLAYLLAKGKWSG